MSRVTRPWCCRPSSCKPDFFLLLLLVTTTSGGMRCARAFEQRRRPGRGVRGFAVTTRARACKVGRSQRGLGLAPPVAQNLCVQLDNGCEGRVVREVDLVVKVKVVARIATCTTSSSIAPHATHRTAPHRTAPHRHAPHRAATPPAGQNHTPRRTTPQRHGVAWRGMARQAGRLLERAGLATTTAVVQL